LTQDKQRKKYGYYVFQILYLLQRYYLAFILMLYLIGIGLLLLLIWADLLFVRKGDAEAVQVQVPPLK